jgi:small subunit ribosomal protein S16
MAVVIRLQRIGKPKHPHFRLVAIERSRGSHGEPIEVLGHYHPKADKLKEKLTVDQERYAYWVSKGALPSETVATMVHKLKKEDGKTA